eukprot:2555955-Prorocentrum_lima.AAC.1
MATQQLLPGLRMMQVLLALGVLAEQLVVLGLVIHCVAMLPQALPLQNLFHPMHGDSGVPLQVLVG